MPPLTTNQLGVCSWSLQATSADDLADKVKAVGVTKVQMALTAHRDDPGLWDGVDDKLAEVGAKVVSGMFGTIGEDYTSPKTIHETGGFVPDQHWEGNLTIAKDAAKAGAALGLKLISTHAGFLPASASDP